MGSDGPVPLPPGRSVDLEGRGTTFLRELPGPPGAPTVLLLHGWTASADLNWFGCYATLGERYRVIALDHRGHGRGIRSARAFTLEDCADDAGALVRALGLEQVITVGYSMGGPVAKLLWRRHRDLVGGLVLCSTSADFGKAPPERALFLSLLGASAFARVTPGAVRHRLASALIDARIGRSPLATWFAEEMRRNDLPAVLRAGWEIGCFDARPWAGEIDVPTAVVVTGRDDVVHPARQRDLAARIPNASVHVIDGGHAVCATQPEVFAAAVVAACDEVVSRRVGGAAPACAAPTPA